MPRYAPRPLSKRQRTYAALHEARDAEGVGYGPGRVPVSVLDSAADYDPSGSAHSSVVLKEGGGRNRGFKSVARRIARQQGIPLERAQAILAARTRAASPAAKRKNPALKRVKGKAK